MPLSNTDAPAPSGSAETSRSNMLERSRLVHRASGMLDASYVIEARADRCSNKTARKILFSVAGDIRDKAAAERKVADALSVMATERVS